MSEDVYAIPDLTKKVRYGRGEREQEMEERGEREERIVDIYVTADDLHLVTQQDAVQENTAQVQCGGTGSDQSKKNCSRAAAVCLVLLCLLLAAAAIIGLVIKYSELNTEKNNLVKDLVQLQSKYNNLTEQKDQSSFDLLQSRFNNLTEQKEQLQSSFDLLQSNYNNATAERQLRNKMLCEPHGFTFDGGVCYYVSPELETKRKKWKESRQYCTARQSDLIVINSRAKQDLVERVAGRNLNMWLGLTDRVREGVWTWVDETETPLTTPMYWAPGQPDNDSAKDCVVFWNGGQKGWYDKTCDERNRWICERVLC